MIAVFGGKTFEVSNSKIYTPNNMQHGSSLNTEKQDAQGKKPSTYNKGPGLDNMSFDIRLDASLGVNPRKEWQEWGAIKDSAVAYPFILGQKPLGNNKWLLVDVQGSSFSIDNRGNILAMDLALKFDEYVRPGKAEAATSVSGGSGASSSVPGIQLADYKTSYGPEDKSPYKRNNVEMMRVANMERKLNRG